MIKSLKKVNNYLLFLNSLLKSNSEKISVSLSHGYFFDKVNSYKVEDL